MKKLIFFVALIAIGGLAVFAVFRFSGQPRTDQPVTVAAPPPPDVPAISARAEAGDAAAQVLLAKLYAKGEGVTNSFVEAVKWYKRAADQGNADAQAGLGELYEAGRGVAKDQAEAIKLYRLAAAQGNAGAQYTLGFLYESGGGVPQNHVEAAKWFKLAAEQGDALAQFDLGQRYELGVGVALDKAEGLKWLTLAAAQGQADATDRASRLKSKMTSQEIAEAKRRVAAFSPTKSTPPAK